VQALLQLRSQQGWSTSFCSKLKWPTAKMLTPKFQTRKNWRLQFIFKKLQQC
jgi:hypothetical protein